MGSCRQYSSSCAADEALTLRLRALRVEVEGHLWQQQQQEQQQQQIAISVELHTLQPRNIQAHCPFPSDFHAGLWYGPPHAS